MNQDDTREKCVLELNCFECCVRKWLMLNNARACFSPTNASGTLNIHPTPVSPDCHHSLGQLPPHAGAGCGLNCIVLWPRVLSEERAVSGKSEHEQMNDETSATRDVCVYLGAGSASIRALLVFLSPFPSSSSPSTSSSPSRAVFNPTSSFPRPAGSAGLV